MNKQKITQIILMMVVGFGGLGACSKWNQDPMNGKDSVLNDGTGQPTIPSAPKPVESDAIRIDTVDFFSFKETRADNFVITSRVLLPDYTQVLSIDNLSDFPGATFDPVSGKFAWTPAQGFVDGAGTAGDGMTAQMDLQLKVIATNTKSPGSAALVATKQVHFTISRNFIAPEIVSIQKSKNTIREGEFMTVTVKIHDPDATSDTTTWPTLQISSIANEKSLAGFTTVQNMLSLGNGQFQVNISVDLSDAELTKSEIECGFAIKAISRFSQASPAQNILIDVYTSLNAVQSTWMNQVTAVAGQKIDYSFTIFDPKDEDQVSLTSFTGLPTGATANCTTVTPSILNCEFVWQLGQIVTANTYTFNANINIRNQNSTDTLTKTQAIPYSVKVNVPGPTPTPKPTPTLRGGN